MNSFELKQQHNMKLLNDQIRGEMLARAESKKSDYDKVASLCNDFLTSYEYDYSVLMPQDGSEKPRMQKEKSFSYNGKTYYSGTVRMIDPDPKHHLALSPSIHALKMGTCASFSRELEWFAKELKLKYEIVDTRAVCYDNFSSRTEKPILRDMLHRYIVLFLDGMKYKIDIAGALMAKDYKRKHPDSKISAGDFVLVDEDSKNPFDQLKQTNEEPNSN